MMEYHEMLTVLSACFAPLERDEWKHLTAGPVWSDFLDASRRALQDDGSFGAQASPMARLHVCCPLQEFLSAGEVKSLFAPPTYDERQAFFARHFTGGLPESALPVESLYEPWSNGPLPSPFSQTAGMYQGPSAQYMRDVVQRMGMQVPPEFLATPDHLALELDLAAVLLRLGRIDDARQFVVERLAWLTAYRMRLLELHDEASGFYIGLVDVLVGLRVQLIVYTHAYREETAMSEHAITRRSFLAGSAGAVALTAAAGYMGFDAWEQAHADEAVEGGETKTVHSLCNACSSKCGFTAYVVDGRLTKLIGDEAHPYAKGKLCARGYGYSQIAYSKDRLTDPLKKNEQGQFEAISWEQAYAEIADKIKSIIGSDGPQALAMVQDPRPSGKYYTKRFMHALGSANVYTHGAACNLSKESGMTQAIGAASYSSDVANSKMTMFIGRSYADAIRPSSVTALQKAHEKGAHIVLVDPRCSNSRIFADEWVPINPGTDLALVLAMSNVLVTRGLYDKEFVAANGVGFEDWAAALAEYPPEWAEKITGIPADTIARLAVEFADAAPAASIEPSWRGAFGCSYANSGETARAICLFNTLLGCWNQKGGALLTPSVKVGELTDERFADPAKPEAKQVGAKEYPLALSSMGTNLAAAQAAKEGTVKGMFFYNSNMAAGYSNTKYLAEALSNLELCVAIDVQMSETAMLAHYVLPDTSYLERLELPEFIGGKVPAVTLRDQVLEKVHPNTKPVDQIFSELAEACGVGQYFRFNVDELADAQLQTLGLSLDALKQAGTSGFPEKAFSYGSAPTWKTPTGKVQFTSEACEKAGLSPYPVWVEPATMPMGNGLRLIGGKQAIHSHTQTGNIEDLMQITKDYDLTRVWLNADTAARLGIADGDEVEVTNTENTGRCRVKVTQRLNPTALYMPSHYGCSSPDQHTAYDVGLRQMDFVPFHLEPGYGAAMTQEAVVDVKKVGA